MTTDLILNALDQAAHDRRPTESDSLIYPFGLRITIRFHLLFCAGERSWHQSADWQHQPRLRPCLGRNRQRLVQNAEDPKRAPWKTKAAMELATLEWMSWLHHQRHARIHLRQAVG
jgi:putative transposase